MVSLLCFPTLRCLRLSSNTKFVFSAHFSSAPNSVSDPVVPCNNMNLSFVIDKLNSIASPHLAEKWDNVGLLVEPSSPHLVERILFTNDLTEAVLEEGISKAVNLIVAYHPPIFVPFKRLTQSSWKERILVKCIENRIAIYSPHTALDSATMGINDWLLEPLNPKTKTVISPTNEISLNASISLPKEFYQSHDRSIWGSYATSNIQFFESASKVEFELSTSNQKSLVKFIADLKDATLKIDKKETISSYSTGVGRKAQLSEPITLGQTIERIKTHLGLEHVMVAYGKNKTLDSKVSTVAVCAGSGGSVLRGLNVDLLFTGEMSHHEILDACANGRSVLLTRHSNCERGYLQLLGRRFSELAAPSGDLTPIEIECSVVDADPLVIL